MIAALTSAWEVLIPDTVIHTKYFLQNDFFYFFFWLIMYLETLYLRLIRPDNFNKVCTCSYFTEIYYVNFISASAGIYHKEFRQWEIYKTEVIGRLWKIRKRLSYLLWRKRNGTNWHLWWTLTILSKTFLVKGNHKYVKKVGSRYK